MSFDSGQGHHAQQGVLPLVAGGESRLLHIPTVQEIEARLARAFPQAQTFSIRRTRCSLSLANGARGTCVPVPHLLRLIRHSGVYMRGLEGPLRRHASEVIVV